MADVDGIADVAFRANGDGERSRAQMMLVGAVVLAVVLVALALVLNSVIFTENLATRDQGSDIQDATQFRSEARGSVAGSIIHVNDFHRGGDFHALYTDEYHPVLDNFSEKNANIRAMKSTSATVEDEYGHPGTQIVDNNNSLIQPFLPRPGGPFVWTVSRNVTFRRFHITANKNLLNSTTDGDAFDTLDNEESTIFFIEFTDSRERTWYIGLWRDSSNPDMVKVASHNDTAGTFSQICTTTSDEVRLDFSHQTLTGTHCDAFEFTEDIDGKTTINYWNGQLASGTYRLIVDRAEETLRDVVNTANYGNQCNLETYHETDADGSPFTEPAIYSTIVDSTYRSSGVEYDGDIYVEPKPIGTKSVAPTVTQFDVFDDTELDGHFTVTWDTSDPTNEPVNVTIRLYDSTTILTGNQTDEETGLGESGTIDLDNADPLEDHTIEITAMDNNGNSRVVTQEHLKDGNDTGCPP